MESRKGWRTRVLQTAEGPLWFILCHVALWEVHGWKVISLWGERADNERQESQSTDKECCPFTEAETILCRHCFRYCHIEYLRSESLILVLFHWLEVPMKQLYITDLTSSPTVSSLPSVRLMCSFCCCNAAQMTRIWHLRIRCHYKYVFLGFPEGGGMLWL